ncbi:hypothetical protein JCM12856_08110 [Spirochaeta dissipatitropha]
MLKLADQRGEEFFGSQAAKALLKRMPASHCTRNGDGRPAETGDGTGGGTLDDIRLERCRTPAAGIQGMQLPAVMHKSEAVTAKSITCRFQNGQGRRNSNGGIYGVAALL